MGSVFSRLFSFSPPSRAPSAPAPDPALRGLAGGTGQAAQHVPGRARPLPRGPTSSIPTVVSPGQVAGWGQGCLPVPTWLRLPSPHPARPPLWTGSFHSSGRPARPRSASTKDDISERNPGFQPHPRRGLLRIKGVIFFLKGPRLAWLWTDQEIP